HFDVFEAGWNDELATLLPENAPAPGARPHPAFGIGGDTPDKQVGKPGVLGEMIPFALKKPVESRAFAPHPDCAVRRVGDRKRYAALPMVRRVERFNFPQAQGD